MWAKVPRFKKSAKLESALAVRMAREPGAPRIITTASDLNAGPLLISGRGPPTWSHGEEGTALFTGKQHSKFDPQDRGLSRGQKILQRFFPEKQLIIRSGERMRTLRLSTNRQAVLVKIGRAHV